MEGNRYSVEDSLRGKKIQIRYNPFDLSLIQIWMDRIRYEDAKPLELRSQKHSKLPEDPGEPQSSVVSNYLELLKQQQEEQKRKALGTTSYALLKEKKERGEEGTC